MHTHDDTQPSTGWSGGAGADAEDELRTAAEWFVTHVLGVTEERIARRIPQLEAGLPPRPLHERLFRSFRLRAALAGGLNGLRQTDGVHVGMMVLTHLDGMRQTAWVRAALEYERDPQFFLHRDWSLVVLELDREALFTSILVNHVGVAVARMIAVRAARAVASKVPLAGNFLEPIAAITAGAALEVFMLRRTAVPLETFDPLLLAPDVPAGTFAARDEDFDFDQALNE